MNWTTIIVSAIAAFGSTMVGRSASRTRRQEKRDDFALITESYRTDLSGVKTELAQTKTEISTLKRRADDGDELTRWLARWVRSFVAVMREAHLDIPPRPQPEPPSAAELLHDIGV